MEILVKYTFHRIPKNRIDIYENGVSIGSLIPGEEKLIKIASVPTSLAFGDKLARSNGVLINQNDENSLIEVNMKFVDWTYIISFPVLVLLLPMMYEAKKIVKKPSA